MAANFIQSKTWNTSNYYEGEEDTEGNTDVETDTFDCMESH